MTKPLLFTPIRIKDVTFKNRVVIAPMATDAASAGMAQDCHFAHWGGLVLGGAGCAIVEASAVTQQGRITNGDLGLWSAAHVPPLRCIATFMRTRGVVAGIQIAHGGRKASLQRPWHGNGALTAEDLARGEEKWETVAPTCEPMAAGPIVPRQLSIADLELKRHWADAAARALEAGFEVLEIHNAHGYLMHQFLSPLSNTRNDAYGGVFAGRTRFPLEVAEAVRAVWPTSKPLFLRVSAVDGIEGGWSLDDSVAYARALKARGVEVIDCSSGGLYGSATRRSAFRRSDPAARPRRAYRRRPRGSGQSGLAADGGKRARSQTGRSHGRLAGRVRLVAQASRVGDRAHSRRCGNVK